MRKALFILATLTLINCTPSDTKEVSSDDRFVLIPEPDKDLREEYEKKLALSKSNQTIVSDSEILDESSIVKDEANNDYLTEELKPIRANFKRINSIETWDLIKTKDLWNSVEGGQASFYYSEQLLEKIIVRQFGESFQSLTEYYMLNESLSFVFVKTLNYNRPIYWDSIAMKESNDDQVWDIELSEIIEDRSYFKDDKLIHQLSNQDCGAPFSEDYLEEENKRIRSALQEILNSKTSET